MIPEGAAALLGLLGCVAPGLVFQLRRERYTPQQVETSLREASRVALTSLLFTTASLALVVWLSSVWTALPNFAEWLRQGQKYLPDHYAAVAAFFVLEVGVACLLAVVAERVTRGEVRGDIAPESVLFKVFRLDPPQPQTKRVMLWVTTENGTQFQGALRHYTPSTTLADREVALGGKSLRRLPANATPPGSWEELPHYDAVVIPGSDIRHIVVGYVDEQGEPLHASAPGPRRAR